jgi:thioesterase domain-containing protein
MLAFLDTTPPTAQDPAADLAGREYGLDLSLALQVAQQVLDDLKRLFHHHIVLTDNYVVRPYPGRITLFRPSDAPFTVPTHPDRGWGSLAAAVDVHLVPGQHHSMVKEPHVQVLARELDACLRRAEV